MVGSQLWGFIASPFMLIFYATVGLFYTKTAQCKDTLSCSFEDDQFDSQGLPPRDSIQDYMDHVVKLIKGVVSGLLSEALGLSKDHLTSLGGYESQRLICHYYPACPEPHLTQGAMKHTDPYFLTVVTQDHLGGLQVLKDNQWLDVPPVEAALVINGGDFMQDFVKKVLETIELKGIKDSLVGTSGVSGLSHEQRKRLTISVELVANSSDIFLDEPTTGLDARSAAIVIRAVKNVAVTDRTIVCTIHQPSIDIFEAFDEVISKERSTNSIACVTEIKNNYNPATWMVEVSSAGSKQQRESKETKLAFSWIEKLGVPYHISSRCCRSPYNLFRLGFRLASSLIYGILLWEKGTKLENQQSLFSVFGSMYSAVIFCGICNCASVLPYVTTKRRVYYREKLAGMYESWAYSLAQVVIEIPYIFAQVVIFTGISYTMIGYYGSAYKVFWYMNTMFCSLLYFNYMGMTIIAITPSFHVAAVLQQSFYSMFNLFSAFMVPRLRVPNRWIWLYYITPSSLT